MAQALSHEKRRPYIMIGIFGIVMIVAFIQLDILVQAVPKKTLFVWQVSSGALLSILVLYQLLLLVFRICKTNAQIHHKAHRWVGAVSTVIFAFHAVRFGYAWTNMLAICFCVSAISGLMNREVMNYKKKGIYYLWYWTHMAISVALFPLIVIHVWVALSFE